jgi:uncharacterized integral membrane protein
MLLSLIIAVAVSIVAVYFASYNPSIVEVNIFGFPVKASLGIIIVVAMGVGAILGVLVTVPAVVSRSWALIRSRKKIQDLQDAMQPVGKQVDPLK